MCFRLWTAESHALLSLRTQTVSSSDTDKRPIVSAPPLLCNQLHPSHLFCCQFQLPLCSTVSVSSFLCFVINLPLSFVALSVSLHSFVLLSTSPIFFVLCQFHLSFVLQSTSPRSFFVLSASIISFILLSVSPV